MRTRLTAQVNRLSVPVVMLSEYLLTSMVDTPESCKMLTLLLIGMHGIEFLARSSPCSSVPIVTVTCLLYLIGMISLTFNNEKSFVSPLSFTWK